MFEISNFFLHFSFSFVLPCWKSGLVNMQTSETVGNHIVNGFVLSSTHTAGDAMNKFAGQLTSRVATASDAFCGNINGGAVSFSSFPQTSPFQWADRFLEAIPLPNALTENHREKEALPAPLGCPLENMRYSPSVSGLNAGGPSLETMLHGYGGLPFPPELVRRVVGRTSLPIPAQPARSCHSREWPVMEQVGFGSHSHDSSQYSNELSLSLVTSRPSVLHGHLTTLHKQCSEMSCSNGVSSYSLPEHTSCSSKNHSLSFKTPQLPPLLSGSRFLEAMQEILAAIACYALENVEDVGVNFSFSSIGSSKSNGIEVDHTFVFQKQETSLEAKKKHLLSLLQMVYTHILLVLIKYILSENDKFSCFILG